MRRSENWRRGRGKRRAEEKSRKREAEEGSRERSPSTVKISEGDIRRKGKYLSDVVDTDDAIGEATVAIPNELLWIFLRISHPVGRDQIQFAYEIGGIETCDPQSSPTCSSWAQGNRAELESCRFHHHCRGLRRQFYCTGLYWLGGRSRPQTCKSFPCMLRPVTS